MSRYLVVRGEPVLALVARSMLEGLAGVRAVTADPSSGRITIAYDGRALAPSAIIHALTARGCLREVGGGVPPLEISAHVWRGVAAALVPPLRGGRTRGLL